MACEYQLELAEQPTTEMEVAGSDLTVFGVGEYIAVYEESRPYYDGPYSVTPTRYTQVLETHGKAMSGDVTVNPIPSNYGLIEWDGAVLRVS